MWKLVSLHRRVQHLTGVTRILGTAAAGRALINHSEFSDTCHLQQSSTSDLWGEVVSVFNHHRAGEVFVEVVHVLTHPEDEDMKVVVMNL